MFGIPGMLWWGLAAGIPILIHLFARQRYKRIQWAAMEFLLRAYKKTRKRIRLEHLLLLLLRILAMLLFFLALSDPRVETGGVLGRDNKRREIVIVLDTSFSMGLQGAGSSPFGKAREQAASLVRSLHRERLDTVTLITAGRPAHLVLKGDDDLDRVLSELEQAKLGDGTTDLLGAFRQVEAVMADLAAPPEVFLFSDLQKSAFVPRRSDFLASSEEAATERPQELLQSLLQQIRSKNATINMVAPAAMTTDNVAVIGLRLTSKAAIARNPTDFVVTIRNFGQRATGGTIQFHVDGSGAPAETAPVETLPPGGHATHAFRHVFPSPGNHYVEAVFVADNLNVDNRRRLAINVRDQIHALIVDGSAGAPIGEEASFYLARALVPRDDARTGATFRTEILEETSLEQADLRKVDVLILMNASLLSPPAANAIADFVEDGGGLLIFLGDKTRPQVFNNLLWREGSGVLPAKIGAVQGHERYAEGESHELQIKDLETPPLKYFSDPEILPWVRGVPIYKFFGVSRDEDDVSVRLLAVFGSQNDPKAPTMPAILEKTTGNGRCILVTTSGDESWNDLPALPIYLPLIHELTYHLAHSTTSLQNILVGSTFYMVLKEFFEKVVVARGGQATLELKPRAREGHRGHEIVLTDLNKAGIYRLDLTSAATGDPSRQPPRRTHYVAVNVDTAESDLSRVGEDFLFASFPGTGIRYIEDLEEARAEAETGRQEQIWWWLFLLCGICLLAETALSQWFGARARSSA